MRGCLLRASDPMWTSFLDETPHDFYHLPAYALLSAAEEGGEPWAIYVEDRDSRLLLPLVVRPLTDGGRDAKSPYGYPGPIVTGTDRRDFERDALIEGKRLLEEEGIVSLFVRLHPLLNRSVPAGVGTLVRHGDTVSVDLTLPMATLWSQTRHGHRNDINRSVKAGHRVGLDNAWTHFEEFKRLYLATMTRVSADRSYFFDDAYFEGLRQALGERLHLIVVQIDGAVAAAGLFVETCGIVEYHLSATDERFARNQPTKLMLDFARSWAKERGNLSLHLGGGVGAADDSLLEFKAGFSPLRHPFHTLRMVVLEEEYRRLVARYHPSWDPEDLRGYFPSYRRDRVEPSADPSYVSSSHGSRRRDRRADT
jgi:Acetyltransferase (GNAT) domain